MTAASSHIRRIVFSAIFLSLSLVIKITFDFYIPLFGQNGMSIGLSGVFSIIPSILFGPVYGAIVSGLADLLGYLLKPSGAYLPLMTLSVALGGFIRGAIWLALRDRKRKNLRVAVAVFAGLLAIFGLCNMLMLSTDGVGASFYEANLPESVDTSGMSFISKMLISRTSATSNPGENLAMYIIYVTAGPLSCAALGIILLAADIIIAKKFQMGIENSFVMPLLISMLVSGMLVTTINTVILRNMLFASWKLMAFSVIWLPRAIEEVLSNTVKAYFVAVLLGVFMKQAYLRKLVR